MAQQSKEFEGLSFSGSKKPFGTWKDQILGHLREEDSKKKIECLKAKMPVPKLKLEMFILGAPHELGSLNKDCSDKEKGGHEWEKAFQQDVIEGVPAPTYGIDQRSRHG